MGFIRKKIDEWKNKTPAEKVKVILHVVTDIGIGILFTTIGKSTMREDATRGERLCVGAGLTGLSLYASDKANESWDNVVDSMHDSFVSAKEEAENAE